MTAQTITASLVEKEAAIWMMLEASMAGFAETVEQMTFPLVPYDRGYLEDSFSFEVNMEPPTAKLEVKYSSVSEGGFDYAEIQHENMLFRHPVRKGGKTPQAKYLKTGLYLAAPMFELEVAQRIRMVI